MNSDQLKERVTTKINSSNQIIQDLVIDRYVDYEVNRRADLIFLGINTINKLQKELTKNDKPDIEEYDADKNRILRFSKGKIDQIQKEKTLIDTINSTLELCITNNLEVDYNKLDGLLKQFKSESR